MTNVLIVAAHPDDEVLGCGGTMHRLTQYGHTVTTCILASEAGSREGRPGLAELTQHTLRAQVVLNASPPILGLFPNIELNNVPHLALVKFIEDAFRATRAEVVFTHHPADINNDHLHTSIACQAAARLFQRNPSQTSLRALHFMEVQSSTDWSLSPSGQRFTPSAYVEIGEEGLTAKLDALAEYAGVMRAYPHPRSEEAVRGLATFRGGQANMVLAEAFEPAYLDLGSLLETR